MIKKEYYKACDLFITNQSEKQKNEFFNEYGYNIYSNRKNKVDHFKEYSYTNQNNTQSNKKK